MNIKCSHTTIEQVSKLVPHPSNENKHSEKQIEVLAKIIAKLGQRSPIVVSNLSGYITKGHGRLEAIKLLGWEKCAVDYQDYENELEELNDRVADNEIARYAEFNHGTFMDNIQELEIEYEELDLEEFGMIVTPDSPEVEKIESKQDEESIPGLTKTAITRKGDIWIMGNHRLMCGDSTSIDDVEKLIDNNYCQLLFTSPPYSDMRIYGKEQDISIGNISEFLTNYSEYVSTQAINLGIQRRDNEIFPYWNEYIQKAEDYGLKFLSWNVWDKGEAGSIGNQTAMFPIEHEWIFVFGKRRLEINKNKKNKCAGDDIHGTTREKDESTKKTTSKGKVSPFGKNGTVTRITPHKHSKKTPSLHSAMFPVALPEKYILDMTRQDDFVIEPFGGSGSTLIACEKTKRSCLVMELEERYCDIIINRYMNYSNDRNVILAGDGRNFDELKRDR